MATNVCCNKACVSVQVSSARHEGVLKVREGVWSGERGGGVWDIKHCVVRGPGNYMMRAVSE